MYTAKEEVLISQMTAGTRKEERTRYRSESRNREKGRDGRRMKPKKSPIRKARRTRDSDTETERDSSAPSDTDQEETPPKEEKKHTSRKVKSILKSSIRRTRSKPSKNSDGKTLTSSLSSSHHGALAESELCTTFSSEDSDNISEKLLNAYKKKMKVRRIKDTRGGSSATMFGRIKSSARNKKEKFIADSGTGIPIVPIEIASKHGLKVEKVDRDEPGCNSASGHDMKIMGQTEFWVKFDNLKHPKKIHALVAEEAGDEILIDLDLLVEWSILPNNFPMPMDEAERETKVQKVTIKETKVKMVETKETRGSKRTLIKFSSQEEEDFDSNKQMQTLREQLLKEYSEVFKTQLTKEDRIKMDPVKVETVQNRAAFKPVNRMTAIETPIHLQSAAGKSYRKC